MTEWGNSESLCHKAREYYYELLRHDGVEVPEGIARHVEACPFCREQIDRLRETLSEVVSKPDRCAPADLETIDVLSRQFALLGERVHCSQVRPFLPSLLIPCPEIRIPTPITVHVDNCPQCEGDLASLRKLGLRPDQLRRLGRFYAESSGRDPCSCKSARSTAAAFATLSLDETDLQMLEHVSCCQPCRAWVFRQRAQAIADLKKQASRAGVLVCSEVLNADLFDFVLPFGLDADAIRQADGRRDAVVTHVRACPVCMERVQELHRTIYGIHERADSTTSTVCQSIKDGGDECEQSRSPAPRYPLHVQVVRRKAAPRRSVAFAGRKRTAVGGGRTSVYVKTALVAAAVVLVGVILLPLVTPATAEATSVGRVKRAIDRVNYVHVAQYQRAEPSAFHELWVARDRQILIRKIHDETTVYEIAENRKTIIVSEGVVHTASLLSEERSRCNAFVDEVLRTLFSGVPEDEKLSEADRVPSETPGEYWLVCELTRASRGVGNSSAVSHWKVLLDPASHLPKEIEYSRRDAPDLPPSYVQRTKFDYSSESEMDRIIANRGSTD